MIGTGIFTTTGFLVADLGSSTPVIAAWIVGGLMALCGALTYAELAVNMPGNGGEYLYLSKLYHPAVGFLSGWVSLFAGFSAPIAAAAVAFGNYFKTIWPAVPPTISAIVLLLLFTFIHMYNVRLGGKVQNAFTIIKILLITGLIVAAFGWSGEPVRLSLSHGDWNTMISPVFAVSLIFVMYSYSGWNAAAYIGGEIKNPSRYLPLALVVGTIVVLIFYALLNIIYVTMVPLTTIAGEVEVAHIVAQAMIGNTGAKIVSILILLALITSVSAMIMAGSRVYQMMGEDHTFFSWLAKRADNNSPVNAIILQAAISLILILTLSFDAILYYVGFTLSLFAGLTVFSVFLLRKKGKSTAGYRTWGYPVTPVLFLLVTGWMVIYTLVDRTFESFIGLLTLLLGLGIYFLLLKK